MHINEAIREIIYLKRINQTKLAEHLGLTRQNVNKRLNQQNPQLQTVAQLVEALGYEVVLQPKGGHIGKDEQIPIDFEEL